VNLLTISFEVKVLGRPIGIVKVEKTSGPRAACDLRYTGDSENIKKGIVKHLFRAWLRVVGL
jgi:hypothetical protein